MKRIYLGAESTYLDELLNELDDFSDQIYDRFHQLDTFFTHQGS